jgi:hypothetical protein
VNNNERFIVLPVAPWIAAGGPSFGFRFTADGASICLAPTVPTPCLDLVRRTFAVDHVPEQLTWLQAQGWDIGRLFPNGGWLMSWPADAGKALDNLSFAIGTPFPWRQQIPLFHFDVIMYTFERGDDCQSELLDAIDAARAALHG